MCVYEREREREGEKECSFYFPQAHVVKEAILNVLRLSVQFSERWREGVERFGVHEAERMEVEFS